MKDSTQIKFHLLMIKLFEQIGQPWFDACSPTSAYIAIRPDSEPYYPNKWVSPCKYHIFIRVIDGLYQYHIIGPGGNTLFSQTKVDMNMDRFVQFIVDIHKDHTIKWQNISNVDEYINHYDKLHPNGSHLKYIHLPKQIDFTYSINVSPQFVSQSKILEYEIFNTAYKLLTRNLVSEQNLICKNCMLIIENQSQEK